MTVATKIWVIATLVVAAPVLAADQPGGTKRPPTVYHSACSLGESMASKFGSNRVASNVAQQTCRQLQPTMDPANAAEYMRCCVTRLTGGPGPGSTPPAGSSGGPGTNK